MESVLGESEPGDIHQTGLAVMRRAQETIRSENDAHPEYGKMQTTGVVACIDRREHTLTWFSIGDSAVFVCPRRKKPKKMTIEDTDIGELLSQGKITPKTASQATVGHALNRWLGMDVMPESFDGCIRTGRKALKRGDAVLVCSDGFYSKLSPATIGRLVRKNGSPDALVKAARDRGSQDDITVALAIPKVRITTRRVPLGIAIASAAFCFALGFLCGTGLSIRMKGNDTHFRPLMQEPVHEAAPDTLTTLSKENETV